MTTPADVSCPKCGACVRWAEESIDELEAQLAAATLALRNVRAAGAQFKRRCDRCEGACQCVAKLDAEIHRFVEPILGPPSIFR